MFLFNRKYPSKTVRPTHHKISAAEQLIIGANVFLYFVSFFTIVFLFQKTFMSFGNMAKKFGFFLLIAISIISLYAVSRGLMSKIVSFLLSFGVIAPISLAIYLGINYYVSESFIEQNFNIPDDFEIVGETKKLSPILDGKFKDIPHLEKMDLPVIELNPRAKALYVKIDKGLFGYFVIKEMKFVE